MLFFMILHSLLLLLTVLPQP